MLTFNDLLALMDLYISGGIDSDEYVTQLEDYNRQGFSRVITEERKLVKWREYFMTYCEEYSRYSAGEVKPSFFLRLIGVSPVTDEVLRRGTIAMKKELTK